MIDVMYLFNDVKGIIYYLVRVKLYVYLKYFLKCLCKF